MKTHQYDNWDHFSRKFLAKYNKLPAQKKEQLIFRGQADNRWPLKASIDRIRSFRDSTERITLLRNLIDEFKRQSLGLPAVPGVISELDWDLLGRHHGLPSSVLDFTRLPAIASFFAFSETPPKNATYASVWALDLLAFEDSIPELTVIDEYEAIRFNPRAIEQRGVFLRHEGAGEIETLLGDFLTRYDLPTGPVNRRLVLSALDGMMINDRNLFRDLDGAARSAVQKVTVLGQR